MQAESVSGMAVAGGGVGDIGGNWCCSESWMGGAAPPAPHGHVTARRSCEV